jgi:hypothetical protein
VAADQPPSAKQHLSDHTALFTAPHPSGGLCSLRLMCICRSSGHACVITTETTFDRATAVIIVLGLVSGAALVSIIIIIVRSVDLVWSSTRTCGKPQGRASARPQSLYTRSRRQSMAQVSAVHAAAHLSGNPGEEKACPRKVATAINDRIRYVQASLAQERSHLEPKQ